MLPLQLGNPCQGRKYLSMEGITFYRRFLFLFLSNLNFGFGLFLYDDR